MEATQAQKSFSFIQGIVLNKIFICVVFSCMAALGTIPYGYRFAEFFGWDNAAFSLVFGVIFAAAASLANVMLGTYSLLDMKDGADKKIDLRIILVSTIGSVPYGFLCFFGYQNTLPVIVNIVISVVVVIVNAGIGYTAISNLLLSVKDILKKSGTAKTPASEVIVRVLGFSIGLAISVVMYLAACSGITDLLIHFNQVELVHYHAGYMLAILSWLPGAALFANANQIVASELLYKIMDYKKFVKGISVNNIGFTLFCLASGTAIAQMAADSFDPGRNIPDIFKIDFIQMLVQHYLIVIALFSSAALNYFSIGKLLERLKKK
jgi:hypothetical protein